MTFIGIEDEAPADLWTALTSGPANQQVANDPGGDRWLRLVEDAVDMFLTSQGCDGLKDIGIIMPIATLIQSRRTTQVLRSYRRSRGRNLGNSSHGPDGGWE
mgnify:FL=1